MQALIFCRNIKLPWLSLIDSSSIYQSTIANKRIIDYMIEQCINFFSIHDIRIVQTEYVKGLEEYISNGERWGVNITYNLGRDSDKIKNTLLKNNTFISNDDTLIIDGPVILKHKIKTPEHSNNIILHKGTTGELCLLHKPESSQFTKVECHMEVFELLSLKSYFNSNFELLNQGNKPYLLPGYSSEKNIYIGRNVTLPTRSNISPPVLLGDDISLSNYVEISDSIIGNNVIIDTYTQITKSVILDNVYLGKGLCVDKKIITSSKVIDPETESSIPIVDPHIISPNSLVSFNQFIYNFIRKTASLIILLSLLPMILMFHLILPKELIRTYVGLCEQPIRFHSTRLPSQTLWLRVLNFFLIDKLLLLTKVFKGQIIFVGHTPLPAIHKELIKNIKSYQPAIFSYGELYGNDMQQEFEIISHNNYYSVNRSLLLDIKIVIMFILKRFFTLGKAPHGI